MSPYPTLPYVPGDRVETEAGEIGRIETRQDTILHILLDSGTRIRASVFDVLLVTPAWAVGG